MEYLIYAFIGLLVIGFFVSLWFAAKRWKWFDLTLLTFAMFAAMAALPLMSGVLRVRTDWEKVRKDLQSRLDKANNEIYQIKYGSGNAADGPALVELQAELSALRTDAGRVWRGMSMTGVQLGSPTTASSVTLSLQAAAAAPPADPNAAPAGDPAAAAAAPAGPTSTLEQQTVVFAFAEGDFNGTRAPMFYMGDFIVSEATPTQVTLQSLMPLHPKVAQALNGGQVTTWALYELAPVDGHRIFTAPGSKEDVEQLFGRVDDQLVRTLLENKVPPAVLEAYLKDGKRGSPDDPEAAKWTRIEFLAKTEVPVDSPDDRNASDGGYYDVNGQAVDRRLKRGEGDAVAFDPAIVNANQAVFLNDAAKGYIQQNAAKLIDTYFVRPLNDYGYSLRSMKIEIDDLAETDVVLNRDLEILTAAINKTVKLQQEEQDLKDKLEKESALTRKERDAVSKYYAKLDAELKDLRARMSEMYEQNLVLVRKLASVQQKLTAKVEPAR